MTTYNPINASYICGSTKPKYNWRRFCKPDLETVESIILPETYAMFGNAVIRNLVESSIEVNVYLKPRCHELVACICFKTYPNLPALPIRWWTEWMQTFYNNYTFTSLNTYFVHWATWCDPAYRSFDIVANFKLLFEIMFTDHFYLNYIIFILPPGFSELKSYQILLQIATLYRIYPTGFGEGDNVQSLWVCDRSVFFEKIIIRRALPEDNDDLVEILDADCKELRELYGDYYIAEIVLKEDSTRKIIVAEYDDRAIGMICVNSDVNIDNFFEYFDLDPYHGLRKHLTCELVAQTETEFEEVDHNAFSPSVEVDKETTIKEDSVNDRASEEMFIVPLDTEEEKNSEDYSNLMGETYDIFKKFAFNSSSSSESSISEQDWTSDVTLLQTRVELEMAQAKQVRKNLMSTTNLIWGQLSINSSTRLVDYKSKAKHLSVNAIIPKQFTSESNAFIIELYGIRSDYNKRLTYLLLEAMFETFPSRDYCLITMPTYYQAFPGLDYLIKPVPRQYLQFEHDLFLLYKYAFYGEIDVRIATNENIAEITAFLETIPKSKAVLKTIEELLTNSLHLKYVINVYSNEMLIGVAILEVCNELYFLRTNFDISSMISLAPENRIESNGFLKYFTLVPMYRRKHDIIVAEFFRLTGFKRFFYFVKDSNKQEPHATILPYMFPIRPRRRIVYHPEKLSDHVPPDYILQEPPLIALYTLSTSNLGRKNLISARIVVVGPSTTALSFLETLIFEKPAQKFWFMNLLLISPHGHFEAMINENESMALARPAEVYYNYKYLQLLSIRTWVNIVHGSVIHIDKHNKCITINRDRQVKYDILYIFTGLEFGLPKLIPYTLNTPGNFLTVNSWHDAEILGIKLPLIDKTKNKHNIIVYGRTIEAYCILNYLLQTVQATSDKQIVFVLPAIEMKNDFGTSTFNDEFVDEYIKKTLISSNVKMYENYQVTKWEVDKHDLIRTVLLESKFEICQLDCSLFISCEKKSVGFETIKAFNDSGLVFDGRLVINKSFQTNDPDIFAAGPVTKYRRMLYADAYRHEYFNSAEIGRELALRLVARLDPTFDIYINQDFPLVVQKFKMPVIVSCVLPSNLNYLYITPPGQIIPHKVAILKDNYGLDIITGCHGNKKASINYTVSNENTTSFNRLPKIRSLIPEDIANKSVNYFRCHLNEFNLVTTIVCLTTKPIDKQNIINMYGKHEKLLNNLVARYEANLLTDLFEFFQNSWWFYAVAHDRFSCLQNNNIQIFLDSMIFSDENLIKDIICLFKKNNNHKLTDERKLLIVGSYLYANQAKIEKNVLQFLNDYRDELPMFISPENVDQFVKKLTLEEVFHGIEELFIKASEL